MKEKSEILQKNLLPEISINLSLKLQNFFWNIVIGQPRWISARTVPFGILYIMYLCMQRLRYELFVTSSNLNDRSKCVLGI